MCEKSIRRWPGFHISLADKNPHIKIKTNKQKRKEKEKRKRKKKKIKIKKGKGMCAGSANLIENIKTAPETPFLHPPDNSLRPPFQNISVPQDPSFTWNYNFVWKFAFHSLMIGEQFNSKASNWAKKIDSKGSPNSPRPPKLAAICSLSPCVWRRTPIPTESWVRVPLPRSKLP